MAAVELNFDPTIRQLRQFGGIGFVLLPILGWLICGKPGFDELSESGFWLLMLGGLGLLMGAAAAIRPQLLKWVFIGASVVTFPIGFVIGEVVLVAVYLIAFCPIALIFRVMGRDALERQLDRSAESYWTPKAAPKDIKSYYRQS